jgi:hypothetical protein
MTAPPTAREQSSVFEDIVDVFHAPSRVFARRSSGEFWKPLLILAVLAALIAWVTRDFYELIMNAEIQRQQAKMIGANVTPEMLEQSSQMQNSMKAFVPVMAFFGLLITTLFIAGVIWLIGMIFGAPVSYGAGAVIATFSRYPTLIKPFVEALQAAYLVPPEKQTSMASVSVSLARFLDPDTTPGVVQGLAMQVGLFPLWSAMLVAIGVRVIARVGWGKAIAISGLILLLSAAPYSLQDLF